MAAKFTAILTQEGCTSRETRNADHYAISRSMSRHPWKVGDPFPNIPTNEILPVGSVEFVQAVMAHLGHPQPQEIGFPSFVEPWLKRSIRATRAGMLGMDIEFVKPRETIKTFTGFVFDPEQEDADMDEFTREQNDIFMALPADAPVWVSEVVSWQSEWRYYIMHGQIIGAGRYDADGKTDAPIPDQDDVRAAVLAFEASGAPAGYAMDFGVLSTGETALVEINDGWALGYYTSSLASRVSSTEYIELLSARWTEIASQKNNEEMSPLRHQP